MATIRILIWEPGTHLSICAPNEREAAIFAEKALRGLEAARFGSVACQVETEDAEAGQRVMAYLRDLTREIEAERRLIAPIG